MNKHITERENATNSGSSPNKATDIERHSKEPPTEQSKTSKAFVFSVDAPSPAR